MATIVWGHGVRDRGDEKTFVPQGVTVKWWADSDKTLQTTNGFLAIETGGIGTPNDQQGPGNATQVEIYNYSVSKDLEKRDLVALLNENTPQNKLKFVGAEVREGQLCNKVDDCKANGSHICDGVFGKATLDSDWQDTELLILVCRVLPQNVQITQQFGGDQDDRLADSAEDMQAAINSLCEQIGNDPEGAEHEYDSWAEKSKVYALQWPSVADWLAVRWAADYGRKGQITDMFKQLQEHTSENAAEAVWIPRYAEGFTAAAAAKPQEFFHALAEIGGSLEAAIGTLPGVEAAGQAYNAKRDEKAQFSSESWVPDDDAKKATQLKNQQNLPDDGTALVYAGGVVMLIGSNHNLRVEAYVDRQADSELGSLVATKGGPFKVIKVRGIENNKTLVENLLTELAPDKKVKFE
jgi:hypothetical protein